MNILFVMRHSGYVRNFESTLRLLCDRGHTVHLAFQIAGAHAVLDAGDVAKQLADAFPRFTRGAIPVREDAWGLAARELRVSLDYLRYLSPAYRDAPKLRARAMREVPKAALERMHHGALSTPFGRALHARWLQALHRAVPSDPGLDGFLDAHRPDVVVVTPLIEPGAPQAEYVRSARTLGLRTALCVASWDNLTNKGLIHGSVDLVTVWNEMMKREAVDLHRVPAERVVVTGAQPFDHWFDWRPSTTREAFCRLVGLPADRPYLLYLCSSRFVAPDEAVFVRAWLQQLRQSPSPRLQQAGVLVRPHPQNADQWLNVHLSDLDPVVVWPPAGQVPADAESRADYFDSIYHSAAVVGVNTTAEIESAIIGRPVHTLLAPEFRDTQQGTLHFHHLREVNGGLIHVAETFAEHHDQLEAAIGNPGAGDERCRRFVEAFVRPYGIEVPATPKLVEALEGLATHPAPQPERAPQWAAAVRPMLFRAGARLQRDASCQLETKAARKAATKGRRDRSSTDSAEPPGAVPTRASAKAPRSWKALAAAYRELDYPHRVFFGRATADCVPGELAQLLFERGQPERLDYPDADIFLRVTSKSERNRLRACEKEPFTIEWIHRHIRPGDVLYDIGANVGAYSLVAAKKPDGGARVFAFEPSYANVVSLCTNIVINDAAEQITPLPFAVSNADGLGVFALRALESGSARHTLGEGPSAEGPTLYRQPVITLRLDALIERFGLPLPNHIKLDVDGGELAVLEGAARALASPDLRSMLVEISTSLSDEITEVLSRHGMRLETKVKVKNKAGEYLVWYGLFTRGSREGEAVREIPFEFSSP
jgi:FkbM family methyltransferase